MVAEVAVPLELPLQKTKILIPSAYRQRFVLAIRDGLNNARLVWDANGLESVRPLQVRDKGKNKVVQMP